jgi:hypothetical protein
MKSNFVFIAWLPWCFPGLWLCSSFDIYHISRFL